jgi:hypothetical protein
MPKEVKIIAFILERGPGDEAMGILSRSEAEWEIAKHLSDGWSPIASGGSGSTHEMSSAGFGYMVLSRDLPGLGDSTLHRE